MHTDLNHSDIFVALDLPDNEAAKKLLTHLPPEQTHIKIGLEMFTRSGTAWVKEILSLGYQVFLDLKLYDIPKTVANTVQVIGQLGVSVCTLHASGGMAMLCAARQAADALPFEQRPLLIAVTVLTSFDASQWKMAAGKQAFIKEDSIRLAQLAFDSGMDGIVCSPHEAAAIRALCGPHFKIICPGIRLQKYTTKDDQARIATPHQARAQGADYLVIGRPITQSNNPADILQQCQLR